MASSPDASFTSDTTAAARGAAAREAGDVFVRDLLIVFDTHSAVYPDPAVFILDDQAHPRILGQVAILDASLGAVDDDVVAVEQVPHHGEMWRAVRIGRADNGEVPLLEELPLRWIYLGAH